MSGQQTTVDGEQLATVTLTLVEWANVRAALAEGPFRIVAPIIAKIEQQAFANVAQPTTATQPNGGDADHVSH